MKKIYFLTLCLVQWAITATAQTGIEKKSATHYREEINIPYYTETEATDAHTVEQCRLDISYPADQKGYATIIWFHGGGLTGGKREIPALLKEKGFAVVGAGYRLSPLVKARVCIEDAAAAVAWVFNNLEKYGGDPEKIFLSGHSAGGYLDLMVGMDKKWLAKYGIDANRIAGLLPLSPQVITHFAIRKERGISDKQPVIDEFAPLFHVKKELPPIVLITGDRELEMLGRYEENAYMARMLKLNGHENTKLFELEGFDHGTMKEPGLYLLIDQVRNLLKK